MEIERIKNYKKPDDFNVLRKTRVFWDGVVYIFKHDLSVTVLILISLPVLLIGLTQQKYINFLILLVATGIMIVSEIFNTCIELLCDYLTTEYDSRIKIIKDTSTVATGLSIGVWLCVIIYEIYDFVSFFG